MDRNRRKLEAIQEMLPRLQSCLPADLFGELAANVYVLPFEAPSEADIARGQAVARTISR